MHNWSKKLQHLSCFSRNSLLIDSIFGLILNSSRLLLTLLISLPTNTVSVSPASSARSLVFFFVKLKSKTLQRGDNTFYVVTLKYLQIITGLLTCFQDFKSVVDVDLSDFNKHFCFCSLMKNMQSYFSFYCLKLIFFISCFFLALRMSKTL